MIATVKFSIATQYVKSEHSVTKTIELDDDLSESEIEEQVSELYQEWLSEVNYGGYAIIKTEK